MSDPSFTEEERPISNRSLRSEGLPRVGSPASSSSLPEVENLASLPSAPTYQSPNNSRSDEEQPSEEEDILDSPLKAKMSNNVPSVQFLGVKKGPNSEASEDAEMHPLTTLQPAQPGENGGPDGGLADGEEPFLFSRMDRGGGSSASHIFQYAREGNVMGLKNSLGPPSKSSVKRVNSKDEEMLTALHYAARYNHLECCKLLVERGAQPDIEGQDKMTPLHMAARYRRVRSGIGKAEAAASLSAIDPDMGEQATNVAAGVGLAASAVDATNVPKSKSMPMMAGPQTRQQAEEANPTIDNSVILFLVSKKRDILNKQDFYGCTPLHYASMRGNEVAADHLLMCQDIDIDKVDNEKMTPLHLACTHGHTEIARMLIQCGADVRAKEESLSTPLHLACAEGNTRIISMIFAKAQDSHRWQNIQAMLEEIDSESNTPLHAAVENNCVDAARLCIEKGANVDAVNSAMETPMHLAARVGSLELCMLLYEKKARLDALDTSKQTPLHQSVLHDQEDCARFFLEKGARIEFRDSEGYTPLLLAADQGCVNTTKLLLEFGADINAIEMDERSAVFLAAEQNNLGVLEVLLSDPRAEELQLVNATNNDNNAPLHVAAEKGYSRIVKKLLEKGVDLDAKNEDEMTAMHLAAKNGRTKIVKLLMDADKNLVQDENEDSDTPLHLAAEAGHAKVVSLLLDGGADIDARNSTQWTALDCAAAKGNVKVAQILLENDSPVDPRDKAKVTPMYLACQYGHLPMASLLMSWNANINMSVVTEDPDDPINGANPLDAAIDNSHKDVAKMLIKSPRWREALRNITRNPRTGMRDTPMRKLIRKMPDVAVHVFRQCSQFNDQHPEHEKFKVTFDFEFLDDMFAQWDDAPMRTVEEEMTERMEKFSDGASQTEGGGTYATSEIYDDDGRIRNDINPYSQHSTTLKLNHPLMIMVHSKREDLLDHPLVTSLLTHKWNSFGRLVYYINLSLYALFLIFFNVYMISTQPTYKYYKSSNVSARTWAECEQIQKIDPTLKQPVHIMISAWIVMALAAFALFKEIIQLIVARRNYFDFENAIEWAIYVLAFVSVFNFDGCQQETGIRYWWQWNCGSMGIFLTWLNLVLFIRKFPRFGIYVVMFTDVVSTFLKFSIVFLLFMLAFSITFFLLLQNQTAFRTVGATLMKVFVMMIGELEYDNIFITQYSSKAHSEQVYFDEVTYFVFVLFLICMSILIMNLLVGLAVDNITAVQKQASLKRLAMQVELVLEVETMLPMWVRRRFVVRSQSVKPNAKRNFLRKFFTNTEHQGELVEKLNPIKSEFKQVLLSQDNLNTQITALKGRIKSMRVQHERMESMLEAVLGKLEVEFEDEDEHQDDVQEIGADLE